MSAGYLLDTNVVSETRRRRPDPGVLDFIEKADETSLFLSVLTLGELRKGVKAKRKSDPIAADRLAIWVDQMEATFADRLLPITVAVSERWGEISADHTLPVIDSLLAATALVHELRLVTRNTRHMRPCGVALIDPWN